MARKSKIKDTSGKVEAQEGGKCTSFITHKLIKLEENKRKVIFKNDGQKEHAVTQVDGCLIDEGPRSDYLVSEIGVASVLVELKGTDVEHACQQLFTAVDHTLVKPLLEKKVGFLVVCSKYPRFDSFVAKAKTTAARKFKTGFHVICDQRELEISKVVDIDGPY